MIDIKLIEQDSKKVKNSLTLRSPKIASAIDDILKKQETYKNKLQEVEQLRTQRNDISKNIPKLKKEGEAVFKKAMKEANKIKEMLQKKEESVVSLKKEIEAILLTIPNMPAATTPKGKTEQENKVVRVVGKKTKFKFKAKDHHALGEGLDILDFEAGARLSGSRFVLLKEDGAKLERALINFMLDIHIKNGYKEIFPPLIVNKDVLVGTGQLPKFEEDMYKFAHSPEQYLISTSEIPLTNMYRKIRLQEVELPKKFTSATPCFRKESGSYGKDTRGLIRNHQFDKVELVWIGKPEDSMKELEKLTKSAEQVLKTLEIPYRVTQLCAGELSFASAKTFDLDVWMPGENRYREVSSCSNCTDFQARRMETRFQITGKGTRLVHTLNGSGVAVGRLFAAVIENNQQADGSIVIPKALVKYFGKKKILPRKK